MTQSDSPREMREEFLDLVGAGLAREDIAEELGLSTTAVKRLYRRECRRFDVDGDGLRDLMAGRASAGGVTSPP